MVRPLARVAVIITDDRLEDRHASMVEAAGVRLIVVAPDEGPAGEGLPDEGPPGEEGGHG